MKLRARLIAPLLILVLLLTPALALTPQQAGELLSTYYVDTVPGQVLEQTTVADMLSALGDPYTTYFTAGEYAAFMSTMQDVQRYGIGVSVQLHAQGVQVVMVSPGLGAEQAGIKVEDVITAMEGQSIADMTLETVANLLSGGEGATVRVTVLRDGVSRDYTITRMEIVIPATSLELIDGHIGYISCATFGPETQGHFEDGVTQYDNKADRWLVDLRENGGGEINAAVQAAGTFAGGGNLVYLRDNEGQYGTYPREEGGLTIDPVIVLTSGDTASASEIFASIIRDRQAGLVVGERTFGKGVAQTLLDKEVLPEYFADGSALKLTTSRFFSPNGATNDKVGIIPHLLVEPEYVADVALLLSAPAPKGNTTGKLRLNLSWRWYVDLEQAMSEEYRGAFAALLEAIPGSASLWLGTGGTDGWRQVTPAELAAEQKVADYRSRDFHDTAENPYATEISALATYGLIAGDGKGGFQPEKTITRAELCAVLAQAMRYTSVNSGSFADVSPSAWYADEVEALSTAGLINGYSDGLFHPDAPMDHQQFMTVLARVAREITMGFHEAAPESYDEMMNHPALVPYPKWARESVWLLDGSQKNPVGAGVSLLWDSLTEIDPTAPTTRGEAACALYNVLSFSGILPA